MCCLAICVGYYSQSVLVGLKPSVEDPEKRLSAWTQHKDLPDVFAIREQLQVCLHAAACGDMEAVWCMREGWQRGSASLAIN